MPEGRKGPRRRRGASPAKPAVQHIAGSVWLFVDTDPPTTTHHDKDIITVRTRTRAFTKLRDSDRLRAAQQLYSVYIPPNRGGRPLAPPLRVQIVFRFRGEDGYWWDKKPDADNAAKTLIDSLVRHGWIERDEQVVDPIVSKIEANRPGVLIRIETIDEPPPSSLYYIPNRDKWGVIQPLPEGGVL